MQRNSSRAFPFPDEKCWVLFLFTFSPTALHSCKQQKSSFLLDSIQLNVHDCDTCSLAYISGIICNARIVRRFGIEANFFAVGSFHKFLPVLFFGIYNYYTPPRYQGFGIKWSCLSRSRWRHITCSYSKLILLLLCDHPAQMKPMNCLTVHRLGAEDQDIGNVRSWVSSKRGKGIHNEVYSFFDSFYIGAELFTNPFSWRCTEIRTRNCLHGFLSLICFRGKVSTEVPSPFWSSIAITGVSDLASSAWHYDPLGEEPF